MPDLGFMERVHAARCYVDRMVALCVPDGSFDYVPMGEQGQGRIAETGRKVWESLIGAFPDLTNEVHSVLDDGSGNAAAEVTISGTQARDFAGIPSKGRRYSLPHAFFFQVEAGHINRIRPTGTTRPSSSS